MTPYAQKILNMINASNEHMTAEQIYLKLKEEKSKVVLATVYNNLNYLCKENMIRRVSLPGLSDRFDKIQKHDHLYCKKCGRISDIYLDDLTETLKSQTGLDNLTYDLQINYICPECRANNGKN